MVFRATLCSTGGLVDGYTIIKANDVSIARELAKEWGEKRIEQLGFYSYTGYVKLVMEVDKIKIKV